MPIVQRPRPSIANLFLSVNQATLTNNPAIFTFPVDAIFHSVTLNSTGSVASATEFLNSYCGYNISQQALLAAGIPDSNLLWSDTYGIALGAAGPFTFAKAVQVDMKDCYAKAGDTVSLRILGGGAGNWLGTLFASIQYSTTSEWERWNYSNGANRPMMK